MSPSARYNVPFFGKQDIENRINQEKGSDIHISCNSQPYSMLLSFAFKMCFPFKGEFVFDVG